MPESHIEFEKKYLISAAPPFDLEALEYQEIRQRYIKIGNKPIQRIRSTDDKYFVLNNKYKDDAILGKVEIEKELSKDEFEHYITNAVPNSFGPLCKKRYILPYGSFSIELDCYDENLNQLMIAEVEFQTLAQAAAFSPPDRFGKEISGSISNKKLYLQGLQALDTEKKISIFSHPHLRKTHKHINKTKDNLKKLKSKL